MRRLLPADLAHGPARLIRPAALLLLAAGAAQAASVSNNLAVSAFIANGCGIGATPIDFGAYAGNAAAPTIDGTGTISVRCPAGNFFWVALNNGANAAGAQRRMRQTPGAAFLNYELYRNAARTQRWGSTFGTSGWGIGSGAVQTGTVYARLPGAQVVPSGPYIDTVTATITY
jgi:spore coat protein U-like protein